MRALTDLNFFVKLAAGLVVMAVSWLVREPLPAIAIAAVVLAVIAGARLPGIAGYLKGTAILVGLVILTWTANLWLQGVDVTAALPTAIRMAARIVATTGAFYFVMETTSPGAILAACSAARLPPMATLVLALVFGLIPMLRDEFERIADAQRARGMEIDGVPLPVRLRYALARGVPLLVQAIRMAQAISVSLTVAGFDAKVKRTTWRRVGLRVERTLPMEEERS